MYKFLPSYVGSKKHWIEPLLEFKNKPFVELFCGSSVLSANLASSTVLVDLDPYVCKIMGHFDQLIVPERFTKEDYFLNRSNQEWWKYAYCFQKMSFSGVFRHSKNGYNVPIKPNIPFVELQSDYQESLTRWKKLNPKVFNISYDELPNQYLQGSVVVSDPPYQGSQASYNSKFDYQKYWQHIDTIKDLALALVVFDRASNLESQGIPVVGYRKMRVNGARPGDSEAIAIYENGNWRKI